MKRLIKWTAVVAAVLLATGAAATIWILSDPARAYEVAMVAGRAQAGVTERFVEIDGHRWRVLDTHPDQSTDPPGRTALVLHGLGTSAEAMLRVAPILAATHRVVIPDLPGFGEHPLHGDAPHDWRLYMDAIERFREHEALGRVDVVGTSMGGAFAAAFAATHPESTGRVVLLSPAGVVAPNQNEFMQRVADGELPLDIRDEASFDEVLSLNFPEPPPMPDAIRRAFVQRALDRRDAFLRIVEDLRPFLVEGCEPLLPAIRAPVLVLYGAGDQLTDPSMLAVWRMGLGDMRGEVLPDAGHVVLYDQADLVAARMRQFLGDDARDHPGDAAP